jgi:acetyl-CoA carboxylase biotin carboxyl carrier protein
VKAPRSPRRTKKGRKRLVPLVPATREVAVDGGPLAMGGSLHGQAREIQALIDLARRNKLSELEVERAGSRIRIRLEPDFREASVPPRHMPAAAAETHPESQTLPQVSATAGYVTVTSPIVGTFYRSPSPDADAYVEESDYVRKGQVLCIVEAMKLMNERESEVDGRIVRILAESTKPVEYGQPLFLIDPKASP